MSKERLIYLPLGGAGEIGMNAYVYGYGEPNNERFILVDLGITFPDMDSTPGVNLILPDLAWLEERADRLEAIFISHAHEDHVGALPLLWEDLRAPVYARPFVAEIVRRKFTEYGVSQKGLRTTEVWPHQIEAGPFTVSFVPVSHSVPASSALLIQTPVGRVIHTGDFKLDESPVVGDAFDEELWQAVSADGVRALVCDSTNVFVSHSGRSEGRLSPAIEELIQSSAGVVAATTFASNIARLKTLADAGIRAGRSICLLGRAMRRMIEAAKVTDVLSSFPNVVSASEAALIPRENLMLLVTGSQGEPRAVSAQLANGKYQGLELVRGDLFLFSSKTIPGNEKAVLKVINNLSRNGVVVIDDSADRFHVSGHANLPDLERIHTIVDPQIVIPMHGERRHLEQHVQMCRERGREAIVAVNGAMIDLSNELPKVIQTVTSGRLYFDGDVLIPAFDGVVRDRIRLALNGHIAVSVVQTKSAKPTFRCSAVLRGLWQGDEDSVTRSALERELGKLIGSLPAKTLKDDERLQEEVVRGVKKTTNNLIGKRPEVSVIVMRIGE